jgi:hypothetical protein
MKVIVQHGDTYDGLRFEILVIDGDESVSVYPLYDCPEDAIIGRDLVSCAKIAKLMKSAYEAGKRGEPFDYEEERICEDD